VNRLELGIDLNDGAKKARQINVRADILASALLNAIKDHYSLNGEYELRNGAAEIGLSPDAPLNAQGVGDKSVLRCVPVRIQSNTPALIDSGQKRKFSQKYARVFLLDQRALLEYDLTYWPAVIGRRDRSDPARNRLLAIDLEGAEAQPTVSRHHACITEQDGQFFIEALQDNNPLFANGQRLEPRYKHPLSTGATLQLGTIKLSFNVRS
jgi:hypothetical protein